MSKFIPKTILVTDCNRGLGIQLVNMLSSRYKNSAILAAGDQIGNCKELLYLKNSRKNIYLYEMDMDSEMSVYTAENEMESHLKKNGLNLLVNNMVSQMDDKNDSVTLSGQTHVNLDRSMLDTAGPHIVAKVFFPHLISATETFTHDKKNINSELNKCRSILINIANFKYPKIQIKTLSNSYKLSRKLLNKSILNSTSKLGIVAFSMFPKEEQINQSSFTVIRDILTFLENSDSSFNGNFYDWSGEKLSQTDVS